MAITRVRKAEALRQAALMLMESTGPVIRSTGPDMVLVGDGN
jgi:hypothetical protein